MPQFLYYLPGVRGLFQPSTLEERGLAGVLEPSRIRTQEVMRGPDGGPGTIVADAREVDCRYQPEAQDWAEAHRGSFWAGLLRGARPGPADLARDVLYAGYAVLLADGNRWQVPMARDWRGATALDTRYALTEDGTWGEQVVEKHQAFSKRAEALWLQIEETLAGRVASGDAALSLGVTVSVGDEVDLCCEALAVNYRLGREEASLLGILTRETHAAVVEAVLGWPEYLAFLKKTLGSRPHPAMGLRRPRARIRPLLRGGLRQMEGAEWLTSRSGSTATPRAQSRRSRNSPPRRTSSPRARRRS